jgi:hypothetical protein
MEPRLSSVLDSILKRPLLTQSSAAKPIVSCCVLPMADSCPGPATIRIPSIVLNTTFDADNDKLFPTFRSGALPHLRMEWTPPPGLTVFFVMLMVANSDSSWSITRDRHYLLGVDNTKTVPGWFRLPLPNIYADGQVCMGNYTSQHPTIHACATAAIDQLLNSPWNSDLLGDITPIKALFSFDSTTNKPLPPVTPWHTHMVRVNNVLFERIVL